MKGRVFVIGLGLIGGSLALCIKKEHKDAIIMGYDIHPEQARLGKMLGVIDEVADDIVEGAKTADLIIISAPVIETETIIQLLSEQSLNPEVIITDTGSTKSKIVANAASLKKKDTPLSGDIRWLVPIKAVYLLQKRFYLKMPFIYLRQRIILKT